MMRTLRGRVECVLLCMCFQCGHCFVILIDWLPVAALASFSSRVLYETRLTAVAMSHIHSQNHKYSQSHHTRTKHFTTHSTTATQHNEHRTHTQYSIYIHRPVPLPPNLSPTPAALTTKNTSACSRVFLRASLHEPADVADSCYAACHCPQSGNRSTAAS